MLIFTSTFFHIFGVLGACLVFACITMLAVFGCCKKKQRVAKKKKKLSGSKETTKKKKTGSKTPDENSESDERKPAVPGTPKTASKKQSKKKKKKTSTSPDQPKNEEIKPTIFSLGAKELLIATGATRRKADYPTMDDVDSDWGDDDNEVVVKKEEVGKKEETKNDIEKSRTTNLDESKDENDRSTEIQQTTIKTKDYCVPIAAKGNASSSDVDGNAKGPTSDSGVQIENGPGGNDDLGDGEGASPSNIQKFIQKLNGTVLSSKKSANKNKEAIPSTKKSSRKNAEVPTSNKDKASTGGGEAGSTFDGAKKTKKK